MGIFRDYFNELWLRAFVTPVLQFIDLLKIDTSQTRISLAVDRMGNAPTVRQLDNIYDYLDTEVRSSDAVKNFYEAKKAELNAQGLKTEVDVAMGFMGTQIAKAVWGVTNKALPQIMAWLDKFGTAYKIEKAELDSLKELAQSGEFGLNAVVGFVLGVTLYPAISASGAPVWRKVGQVADSKIRSNLLAPGELITGLWRGILTDTDVNTEMALAGFTDKDISAYKEILRYYPSPTDFIRFAVRDIFRADVISKYGYGADWDKMQTQIVPAAAKAGMSEDILYWYYLAHWELPSPNQAFEMLHRGVITQDDIRTLLRIADVAPYFIEPFIKISYNPVTRVDLRRLYQSGIYNRDQVKAGYIALGSDPDIAEYLTKWTEQEYAPKDKDLTKAEILKQYETELITKEETTSFLKELDYSDTSIGLILAQEDYKLDVKKYEDEAETVIAEIIAGTKTLTEAEEIFKMLKLTQKAKTAYLNRAKQEVRKLQHVPSIDTLKVWLKKGIIDEKEFRVRMSANKVTSTDIDKYIKEVSAA